MGERPFTPLPRYCVSLLFCCVQHHTWLRKWCVAGSMSQLGIPSVQRATTPHVSPNFHAGVPRSACVLEPLSSLMVLQCLDPGRQSEGVILVCPCSAPLSDVEEKAELVWSRSLPCPLRYSDSVLYCVD